MIHLKTYIYTNRNYSLFTTLPLPYIEAEMTNFYDLCFNLTWNGARVYCLIVAEVLSTRPLIGLNVLTYFEL